MQSVRIRLWALRLFLAGLLAAAATVTALGILTILDQTSAPGQRRAIAGVLMPDQRHYRDIAGQLLGHKHAELLQGLTITGRGGNVEVIRYKRGALGFPSSYLNPNAMDVLARAIGAQSSSPTLVEELRLEVVRQSGRQRWRLRGSQDNRLWRATINPNGTNLQLLTPRPSARAE